MAAPQRFKVIKWGDCAVDAYAHVAGLKLEHCPPIWEALHWGPQHRDLKTQQMLRCSYFRSNRATDFDAYVEALESGDEVLFWCEPSLGSCLHILWVLETLAARGADLPNGSLALSPVCTLEKGDPKLIQEAIAARISVHEVLQPLIEVRRHLASDSEVVRADVSRLPPAVRDWAAVTDLLEDFLPDERGLDLVDGLLLDALADGPPRRRTWRKAIFPIGVVISRLEDPPASGRHDIGSGFLWERLLELGGVLDPLGAPLAARDRLIEICFGDPDGDLQVVPRCTEVRIGLLGKRVRAGEADALIDGRLIRWVGGRMISSERPLRRMSASIAAP
jgi:hypothetical protein